MKSERYRKTVVLLSIVTLTAYMTWRSLFTMPSGYGTIVMICAVIMLYMIMKTVKNAENGRCIVYSVSLWTLYLYFITEMLSVFHKVRFIPLLTVWIIFDIFLLFVLIYRRRKYN